MTMHSILAARSDFSVGESTLTIGALIDQAKTLGEKAVALVDTMSVTAMIDFTNKAKKADIKPIIGVRLRVSDDPAWRPEKGNKRKTAPEHYVIAYALTEKAVLAIFRLLSLGNSEGRFYYTAKISYDDLYAELDNLSYDDIQISMGDMHGAITHPDSLKIFTELTNRVGPVCVNLVPVDTPYFTTINSLGIKLVQNNGARPLVVRPALYEKDGADAAEIMAAITNNNKVHDPWHKSTYNRDFHVVSLSEMVGEIKKTVAALEKRGITGVGPIFKKGMEETDRLVDAVVYQWSKQPVSLPQMAPDEFQAVVEACKKGWSERFTRQIFGHAPTRQELDEVYMPRLKYELGVIQKLNFSGYFLLVQDVVNFAKSNNILVGPGRGSVGGSLIAYLMGITDCDPIRFGLLFERFINPDRIDLPDADLDFMSERRHEIVEYLIAKYGNARVAGVSNFGTLGAASAMRDVSRVAGLPESEYRSSKFVPKHNGVSANLEEAAEAVPEIKAFSDKHSALWPIMIRLEGNVRNFAQHAAGIVVGGTDLVERAVIESRKGSNVVCWDKRMVEDMGLVKMDILGLSTLDLISLTLEYIRERHGKKINLMAIPLDDKQVLDNFAQGQTTGVFQFESGGMRRLLKELGKDGVITFDDVTAATALYRPGPMESGMMDSYYLRKQGLEDIEYDHPLMQPILEATYGVMVYQEQVMQVSRVIAGYSAPDADKLRKIMGKKLPEEMKKERGKFVEGCIKTIGATEEWAGALFDKIETFAGYGFNKSHSVEYTLISYQSCWLKVNYPVEFYAAALTLQPEDKLEGLIKDAARFGVTVSMPDINISTSRFEIATAQRLVVPFIRIKGISYNTSDAIVEARKAGPFKSKAEFISRVERRKCNVKHQELLDRVGAFCRIEPGDKPADHPDRVMDQIELLPHLITANVPINRDLVDDKDTKLALNELITEYREKCGPATEDTDGMPVKPFMGKKPKFMIVQDCPNVEEAGNGLLGFSMSSQSVISAMSEHGLDRADCYWTSLVKVTKADRQISPDEIARYLPYLEREIDLLKPPVIVLLGSGVVRHFIPDFKGKASDEAGKVVYSKQYDANLVIAFSPGEIYFEADKQNNMIQAFHSVMDLLP